MYQELWENVVHGWIEILFAESGHYGQQTNLGIEGQERTAMHCYIVMWTRHRKVRSQSMWDNLQRALNTLEDLDLLEMEFPYPSPTSRAQRLKHQVLLHQLVIETSHWHPDR